MQAPTGTRTGRAQFGTVLVAGLLQGVALVAFPASESTFVARSGFGLSTSEYGLLFLPQVVLAIVSSVAGGALGRRLGLKRTLLAGLTADIASMLLLALASPVRHDHPGGYVVLLVATGLLGLGFGLTVPALNSLVADLRPSAPDRAVLALNALLGLGTAVAPVLGGAFAALDAYWGLAVLTGALTLAVLVVAGRLALTTPPQQPVAAGAVLRAGRFWVLAAAALAYGVVETMAGNWSEPLSRSDLHLGATSASLVLTAFWATVTLGRIVFSVAERVLPARWVYRVLPFVVAAAFVGVAALPQGTTGLSVAVFAAAGLGCSAMLPLSVSFGQQTFAAAATAVSALVIACYQVGYGIAAFGIGPLRSAGLGLPDAFLVAAAVAVALGVAAPVVSRRSRTGQAPGSSAVASGT